MQLLISCEISRLSDSFSFKSTDEMSAWFPTNTCQDLHIHIDSINYTRSISGNILLKTRHTLKRNCTACLKYTKKDFDMHFLSHCPHAIDATLAVLEGLRNLTCSDNLLAFIIICSKLSIREDVVYDQIVWHGAFSAKHMKPRVFFLKLIYECFKAKYYNVSTYLCGYPSDPNSKILYPILYSAANFKEFCQLDRMQHTTERC